MTVRRSSIVWLVLGIVLIMSAVLVRLVALPTLSKLPADFTATQKYEGSISALNHQAFASNDLANLIGPEVPVTADRGLSVDAVDGDTAIVTTDTAINLPDGTQQKDVHTFAVNRVDFSPVPLTAQEEQTLVPAEDQKAFEPHQGVAFSFAPNPPTDGNQIYDTVTMTGQSAIFTGEDTVEGRKVNRYEVDTAGPIQSPALLAQFEQFPSQLPKALVAGLLQAGVVPESSIPAVQEGLGSLPEAITIGFGSTNAMSVAVDQQFGTPLDIAQTQGMYVTVPIDGQDVPILPLSVAKLHTAPADVTAVANDLSKNAMLLSVIGLWFPIVALIVGAGLITLAALRGRKRVATESPDPELEPQH
ncbi:porin PorA family protein [Rhodococcus koreensis]|uniref:porin PorA family protein n=1 Tax=Rhodococcus koreensis TaxID=99653 RepID=UPI00367218CB